MMENKSNLRTAVIWVFITLVIILRVIAPIMPGAEFLANFSGIGAVALFSGAYYKKSWMAVLVAVSTLLMSDLLLAFVKGFDYGFYQGWYYTYLALFAMIITGYVMLKKVNVVNVAGASLAAVFLHWIISDFGVWYGSTFYPQTLTGFWACLVAAIPFELRFLYGTLIYSTLMFTTFELLKAKYPWLALTNKAHN